MRVRLDERRTRLTLVGIGGLVIVAGGLALAWAFTGGGGGETSALPTTGDYRPISIPSPVSGAADPDSDARQGQDLTTVLSQGAGSRSYRVTVSNVSGIGFVNALDWRPPGGMKVVRVTGSSAGRCTLTGGADPRITCAGLRLRPPTCTCRGDGGEVVISFVADRPRGMLAGASAIVSATPVLKIIPAYPQGPDVAPCKPGQTSTASNPCSG